MDSKDQRNLEESEILIGAGLLNLGNTCFMNSVLQCLIYTHTINNYIMNIKHKSVCKEHKFCAMCAFEDLVKAAPSSFGFIIAPFNFAYNLERISHTFKLHRQEDAHEFFMCLIDTLDRSCTVYEPTSKAHLISRMFYGRLRSEVTCAVCQHRFQTYDPFMNLSLDINRSDVTSLVKGLFEFTAVEKMEIDNGYTCRLCSKSVVASKQVLIDELPQVLVIQFKRFQITTGNCESKIVKHVHFDVSLDLTPFMASRIQMERKCSKYSLYAVLVHSGLSTSSGHYYCFVHTSGNWYMMNDSWVEKVNEKTVLEQEAYLLFYVEDCGQSCSTTPSSLSRSDITSDVSTTSVQLGARQAELSSSTQTRPRYGLSQEDLHQLWSHPGEKKAPTTNYLVRVDSEQLKSRPTGKSSKRSHAFSGNNRADDDSSRFQKGPQKSYMRILNTMPASRRELIAKSLVQEHDTTSKNISMNLKEGHKKRLLLQDAELSRPKKHQNMQTTERDRCADEAEKVDANVKIKDKKENKARSCFKAINRAWYLAF